MQISTICIRFGVHSVSRLTLSISLNPSCTRIVHIRFGSRCARWIPRALSSASQIRQQSDSPLRAICKQDLPKSQGSRISGWLTLTSSCLCILFSSIYVVSKMCISLTFITSHISNFLGSSEQDWSQSSIC